MCDQCSRDLKTLLDLISTEEAMAEAKNTLLPLLEQAVQTVVTRQTGRKMTRTLDTIRQTWIQPECSQWVILPPDSDDCLQLSHYRHGFKEPVFQFAHGNVAWSVNAHAYQCDVLCENLPPQIHCLIELLENGFAWKIPIFAVAVTLRSIRKRQINAVECFMVMTNALR